MKAPTRKAVVAPSANDRIATSPGSAFGPPSSAARSRMKCEATVERIARPSAPPTCCIVLSTPEPMPASADGMPCRATSVIGTKVRPMPIDMVTMNGAMSVQ